MATFGNKIKIITYITIDNNCGQKARKIERLFHNKSISQHPRYQYQYSRIRNRNPMDQIYKTVEEKRKYERTTAKDPKLATIEQAWYDTTMSPVQDLFGCPDFLQCIHCYYSISDGELEILQNKNPPRGDIVAEHDTMCSRGSEDSTHWLSKAKGQPRFFDPYDEFQYPGTNQWCQINSLMNVCIEDRPLSTKPKLEKYYEYNLQVIEFIQAVFENANLQPVIKAFWEKLDLPGTPKKCLHELVRHPNRCFNVVSI